MKNPLRHLLTLAVSAVLLNACAGRQADSSFWKEHLVFVSARSGHNDIYLSDYAGKNVRQLTQDATDDAHPRITIDGKIVFASRQSGTWQIHIMNWDGSQRRQLTDMPGVNNYRPFPSTDGRIVFVSDRHLKPQIYSMNPDGTDLQRLSEGDFHYDYPVVNEDGHIYFTSSRETTWDVWRMGPDGSRPTQVTKIPQNVRELAVVPPGYQDFEERFTQRSPMIPFYNFITQVRLVFSAYNETGSLGLYRISEDGTDFAELSTRALHSNRSPVLQPTGQIHFTSDRNGSTDVWTMYPDGRVPRPVIQSPAYDSTN